MTLHFMGETFDSVHALGKAYPAFTGDDAVRAIKAGCETVMEVEIHCHRNSRQYLKYQKARENAKKMPSIVDPEKRAQERRARGGAKTASTIRRRAA